VAKTIIRQFQRDLPYARLYLDDVEEIVSIYRSAFAAVLPDQTCEFYFEIEDNVRLDNFEDLKQHGGHVSEFKIWMTYSYVLTASYTRSDQKEIIRISYGQPQLDYPLVMEESRWELRAKLLSIFEPRRDRWKIFANSVPVWAAWPIQLVVVILAELLHKTPRAVIAVGALDIAFFSLLLAGLARRSRVYLYYRRADQQERQRNRQQIQIAAVISIVSALVGSVGTIVIQMILKRYGH
jgi:hypothetical protein